MNWSPRQAGLRLIAVAALLLGAVACSGTSDAVGSAVPLAGNSSAVATSSTATSSTATSSTATSSGAVSSTTVASSNDSNSRFRPAGFPVPMGATVTLPTGGFHSELTMHVGEVFSAPPADWLPDNSDSSTLNGVVVLAAATSDTLTYQAVKPGTVTIATGPVGHPGGCDQPGKSCSDATPPPTVAITVTK
ncbi:MAG: hypothetical protein M3Y77_19480 [Actinomycetota bacterium]|nr:hypothetical protein [Actinomycetota bacterium]